MTTDDRTDTGALARARALACDVPDWQRVIRVTYDGVPRFGYDDGRPEWVLPGIEEGAAAPSRGDDMMGEFEVGDEVQMSGVPITVKVLEIAERDGEQCFRFSDPGGLGDDWMPVDQFRKIR